MSTRGDTANRAALAPLAPLAAWAARAALAALAALGGLVSGYAALAVAELVSVTVRPEAGPVTAVGDTVLMPKT